MGRDQAHPTDDADLSVVMRWYHRQRDKAKAALSVYPVLHRRYDRLIVEAKANAERARSVADSFR